MSKPKVHAWYPVVIKLNDDLEGSFAAKDKSVFLGEMDQTKILTELHGNPTTDYVRHGDYIGSVELVSGEGETINVKLVEAAYLRYAKKVPIDFLRSVRNLHIILIGGSFPYKAIVTHAEKNSHDDMLAYRSAELVGKKPSANPTIPTTVRSMITHKGLQEALIELIGYCFDKYELEAVELKLGQEKTQGEACIVFQGRSIKAMDNGRMRLGIRLNRVSGTFGKVDTILTLGAEYGTRRCTLFIQGSVLKMTDLINKALSTN